MVGRPTVSNVETGKFPTCGAAAVARGGRRGIATVASLPPRFFPLQSESWESRWIPQAATCCRSIPSWVCNWPDEIKSPPWRPPSLLHMTCAICSSSRRRQMLRERRRCHQHHAHRRSERHTNVQNLTRNHSSRDDGKKTSLAMMK